MKEYLWIACIAIGLVVGLLAGALGAGLAGTAERWALEGKVSEVKIERDQALRERDEAIRDAMWLNLDRAVLIQRNLDDQDKLRAVWGR